MEQDWVAKQEQRNNARWMKLAIALWILVAIAQTAAWYRVSQYPKSDVKIFVTLEDTIYTFPDGTVVTVDRQTWQTITTKPDGTFLINGEPIKLNP